MTLRRTGAIAAVAFIGLTAFATTADAARVAYVVDGDTVRLNSGRYVRLIGSVRLRRRNKRPSCTRGRRTRRNLDAAGRLSQSGAQTHHPIPSEAKLGRV